MVTVCRSIRLRLTHCIYHAAGNFIQSSKASLLASELVVTEIDKNSLAKIKTEEEKNDHVTFLEHWKQVLHAQIKDCF